MGEENKLKEDNENLSSEMAKTMLEKWKIERNSSENKKDVVAK